MTTCEQNKMIEAMGEIIIAHRDIQDSPHLDAIHALRSMLKADEPIPADVNQHILHVLAYALSMLGAISECTGEQTLSLLDAHEVIADLAEVKPATMRRGSWDGIGDDRG